MGNAPVDAVTVEVVRAALNAEGYVSAEAARRDYGVDLPAAR